jgi:protein involved in polysaccharide export with SLBB domain
MKADREMPVRMTAILIRLMTLMIAAVFSAGCQIPRPDIPDDHQIYTKAVLPYDSSREYLLFPGDELEMMFYFSSTLQDVYRLGIGDQIRVEFYDYPALDRTLDLRPDGKITLPYKGDIKVVGLSPEEAARKIDQTYADFLKRPRSTVTLVRYNQRVRELKDTVRTSQRGQSLTMTVNPDGMVTMPLLPEPIMVAGLTLQQAYRRINEAYRPIISGMDVRVSLLAARGNVVYVFGQVPRPGFHELKGPTTALQAIGLAGGFTERGKAETVLWVTRDEARHPVGRILDLDRVLTTGNAGDDVLVRQGDVLYIPMTRLSEAALIGERVRGIMPLVPSMGIFYFFGP